MPLFFLVLKKYLGLDCGRREEKRICFFFFAGVGGVENRKKEQKNA